MDERTVDAYERVAAEYGERRSASQPARAEGFSAALPAGAARLDLGCGPGHYLPHLGGPLVAADAAVPMLAEARRRHPDAAAVACDLEALPFRRGAFAGIWASKCLQHVPAARLPMALADLHRALPVGGLLDLTVFDHADGPSPAGGPKPGEPARDGPEPWEMVTGGGDDFPGRLFALWPPSPLQDVVTGAGFAVEDVRVGPPGGSGYRAVTLRARRERSLADTVGAGMRLLVVGLNPSLYAADAGVGFARPGNRFWPAALAAGLVTEDRDPAHALRRHGVGMTDVVKRATVAAAELSAGDYRAGFGRLSRLAAWLRPAAVCFVGLAGWRAAVDRRARPGWQPRGVAGAPAYVMPSTSGLNAHARLPDLTAHLAAAAAGPAHAATSAVDASSTATATSVAPGAVTEAGTTIEDTTDGTVRRTSATPGDRDYGTQ